jgi:guanylate kinase
MNSTDCKLPSEITAPLLIVLSGPSGVGKDAILSRIKERQYPFAFITTVTTRRRRAREEHQVDYHFLSVDGFHELLNKNGLLEWAEVYGNWYGVPRGPVKDALSRGKDTIIKVDVQGAASIKKILPEAVFIFIAPPSLMELSNRLNQRCSETSSDLKVRIEKAAHEMQQVCEFDYVVINQCNAIDIAVEQIQAIVTAEKCRVKPRNISL